MFIENETLVRYIIALLVSSGPAIISVSLMNGFLLDNQVFKFSLMFLLMFVFSGPMYFLFRK